MAVCTFRRIEKKYLLNRDQYDRFMTEVQDIMQIDEYGLSTICNIYYDTEHFDTISRSMEKPKFKEKLRLRCYGVPENDQSPAFVELKKKYKGIVYKRREEMALGDAVWYLESGEYDGPHSQILREIDYFRAFYNPVPQIFIAYDRIAMYKTDDCDFRVTIDENIRTRNYDLDLKAGSHGRFILPEGYYIMEIKIPSAMPLWMAGILRDLKIRPVSFSKVGEAYRQKTALNQAIAAAVPQRCVLRPQIPPIMQPQTEKQKSRVFAFTV